MKRKKIGKMVTQEGIGDITEEFIMCLTQAVKVT